MRKRPRAISQNARVESALRAGYNAMMASENKGFAVTLTLNGLADTDALGAAIASGLRAGDTVALNGDLGAGKTTLARAILRGLGVAEDVPSPSFTLVQEYETPKLAVRHYDFYRIENAREIDELGIDDALDDGAVLIEWPERAEDRIARDALRVSLSTSGETARKVEIEGPARWAHVFKAAHV
jgi:tRNA threonylcarbamoyl adenosine modification protein YjeE